MSTTIRETLQRSPATAKELQQASGASQATISRQLQGMADVIRLPGGRPPRYALTRSAFGADDNLPLCAVDMHGNTELVARLRPLAHGGFLIEPSIGMPSLLLGANRNGLYDDLPWFLDDLRPQGFLGRQIAAALHAQSGEFPGDPRLWNSGHIGRYLIANGDDLPGNTRIGPSAYFRVRHRPAAVATSDYPIWAERVLGGEIPASSAGGEQPKFALYSAEVQAHVIVKFSPPGNDPVARRWRDILLSEFHATEALHEFSLPAVESRLLEVGGRLFLEARRFDRVGEYGRSSMVSLQAADTEFVGAGSNWLRSVRALHSLNLISVTHLFDVEVLYAFGRLINNTDMHLGNLSLTIEGDVFRLLPAYDMCSMGFAPRGGEVLPFAFTPPDLAGEGTGEGPHRVAYGIAASFWRRLAADPRISPELAGFLDQMRP